MFSVILLLLGVDGRRFIKYFSDEQGIKTPEQIVNDYNEVEMEFVGRTDVFEEIFQWGHTTNVFQYKVDERLIASVSLECGVFHGMDGSRELERNVVSIYSMYVSKEYRGRGYSRELLADALRAIDEHYGMDGDFLLMLHVDPKDRDMELAFSMYYNLNFRRGEFSTGGPGSKRYALEDVLGYRDPCDLITNYNKDRDGRQRYMILTCEYSEFNRCREHKVPYAVLMEHGARLRRILKNN